MQNLAKVLNLLNANNIKYQVFLYSKNFIEIIYNNKYIIIENNIIYIKTYNKNQDIILAKTNIKLLKKTLA